MATPGTLLASEGGSGVRSGPGPVGRRAAGVALVAAGVLLTAAAMRARAFDAALPAIVDGAPAALGHDVGSSAEFEPFDFAVIGPPRGDAAALERALDRIAEHGDVKATIVMGDVLPTDGSDVIALADVLARHWRGLVLLAGPNDDAVAIADPRLAARILPPDGWAFLEHGCLFRGASAPDAEVGADFGSPAVVFEFSTGPGPQRAAGSTSFAPPSSDGIHLGYTIVRVEDRSSVTSTPGEVPRGPSAMSIGREIALRLLWPFAASTTGLIATLVIAMGLVTGGVHILRSTRTVDNPNPHRDSCSVSGGGNRFEHGSACQAPCHKSA